MSQALIFLTGSYNQLFIQCQTVSEKIQGLLASGVRKQFEAEERGSVWEPGQATGREDVWDKVKR